MRAHVSNVMLNQFIRSKTELCRLGRSNNVYKVQSSIHWSICFRGDDLIVKKKM